jgi:muramoyltetrapeptide carboxypeptidase
MADPLRRPAPLRPGDTVAVIAPSGQVDPDRLRLGGRCWRASGWPVAFGERARLDGGYRRVPMPRAGDFTGAWRHHGSLGGDLCARLRRYDARSGRLGWARGDATKLPRVRATTACTRRSDPGLGGDAFGPMVATAAVAHAEEWSSGGKAALFGGGQDVGVRGGAGGAQPADSGSQPGRPQPACTVGSGHPPSAEAILPLEDVREEPYRIDRLLTQPHRSDWLTRSPRRLALDRGRIRVVEDVPRPALPPGVPVLGGFPFGPGRQCIPPCRAVLDTGAACVSAEVVQDAAGARRPSRCYWTSPT